MVSSLPVIRPMAGALLLDYLIFGGFVCRELYEQAELGDLQSCPSQFLIIYQGNDPREPAQVLTCERQFKKPVRGDFRQSFNRFPDFHTAGSSAGN